MTPKEEFEKKSVMPGYGPVGEGNCNTYIHDPRVDKTMTFSMPMGPAGSILTCSPWSLTTWTISVLKREFENKKERRKRLRIRYGRLFTKVDMLTDFYSKQLSLRWWNRWK